MADDLQGEIIDPFAVILLCIRRISRRRISIIPVCRFNQIADLRSSRNLHILGTGITDRDRGRMAVRCRGDRTAFVRHAIHKEHFIFQIRIILGILNELDHIIHIGPSLHICLKKSVIIRKFEDHSFELLSPRYRGSVFHSDLTVFIGNTAADISQEGIQFLYAKCGIDHKPGLGAALFHQLKRRFQRHDSGTDFLPVLIQAHHFISDHRKGRGDLISQSAHAQIFQPQELRRCLFQHLHKFRLHCRIGIGFPFQHNRIRKDLTFPVKTDIQPDRFFLVFMCRPGKRKTVFFPVSVDPGKCGSDRIGKTCQPYQDLPFFHMALLQPQPHMIEHFFLHRLDIVTGNELRHKVRMLRIRIRRDQFK